MNAVLDDVFFALSSPTRRAILDRLTRGEANVQQIAEPFDVALNTVSKHIRVLERAGLVERDVRGREHWCSLRADPLAEAEAFVRRYRPFWSGRLDALEDHLHRTSSRGGSRSSTPGAPGGSA